MRISAEKGNKFAKDIEKDNIDGAIVYLDKVLEFISINLQAEANRCSSTMLGQLNTGEIGRNIKEIIDQQLDKILSFIEQESQHYEQVNDLIPNTLKDLAFLISKDTKLFNVLHELMEMNLFHDFGRIVGKVCSFEIKDVDKIFKYLILLNLSRRIERRKFLPR